MQELIEKLPFVFMMQISGPYDEKFGKKAQVTLPIHFFLVFLVLNCPVNRGKNESKICRIIRVVPRNVVKCRINRNALKR